MVFCFFYTGLYKHCIDKNDNKYNISTVKFLLIKNYDEKYIEKLS